jgi:hypothetical protein
MKNALVNQKKFNFLPYIHYINVVRFEPSIFLLHLVFLHPCQFYYLLVHWSVQSQIKISVLYRSTINIEVIFMEVYSK